MPIALWGCYRVFCCCYFVYNTVVVFTVRILRVLIGVSLLSIIKHHKVCVLQIGIWVLCISCLKVCGVTVSVYKIIIKCQIESESEADRWSGLCIKQLVGREGLTKMLKTPSFMSTGQEANNLNASPLRCQQYPGLGLMQNTDSPSRKRHRFIVLHVKW